MAGLHDYDRRARRLLRYRQLLGILKEFVRAGIGTLLVEAELPRIGELWSAAGCPIPKTRRVPQKEKTMAMSMGGGGPSAPQMNVTPLMDVQLVLIIIFMVIVVSERRRIQGGDSAGAGCE